MVVLHHLMMAALLFIMLLLIPDINLLFLTLASLQGLPVTRTAPILRLLVPP